MHRTRRIVLLLLATIAGTLQASEPFPWPGGRKAAVSLAYDDALDSQLDTALDGVTPEQARGPVVAYEPVWAIGTGEVATPADAQEVCSGVRTRLAELYSGDTADGIRILYGGSVKPGNVAALMSEEDVDGTLVGGASIVVDDFASICRYRDHLQTA